MSRYLSALALVAPGYAMRIATAQAALRGYDAAQHGRRTNSFRPSAASANAEIGRSLPALRARSRELVRNSFIGPRALDVLTRAVIGTDMTVRFDTGSRRDDALIQGLWDDWQARADIEGEAPFTGLLALAFRAMLEGGDAIIRMRALSASQMEGRRVPLALHVGEGDLIDETRDASLTVQGAARARLGVELGEDDRRLGYWLHQTAPGEAWRGSLAALQSTLAPRADVCHLYRRLRPGQVRGVPVFAPILMSARDYADLMDALVVKEKLQASIGVIVRQPNAAPGLAAAATDKPESGGLTESMIRPGMVARLRPGEEYDAFAPAGNSSFEPVSVATLQAIAAGIGLTYDQLTGDLRRANFSSMRTGEVKFRRLVSEMQWHMIVPQILERVTARFVETALLAGLIPRRAHGWRRRYVMPAAEPIDPKKDLEADILAVRAGRMSPQDFIGAWGRDWREVVAESAAFYAETDKQGLIFDIDARQRSRAGQDAGGGSATTNSDAAADAASQDDN
jgi:lambda family phage portal protein